MALPRCVLRPAHLRRTRLGGSAKAYSAAAPRAYHSPRTRSAHPSPAPCSPPASASDRAQPPMLSEGPAALRAHGPSGAAGGELLQELRAGSAGSQRAVPHL